MATSHNTNNPPSGSGVSNRWIHLDFKGAVPSLPRLLEWFELFRRNGFHTVLIEAEDRYPWRCWPELHRPGYSLEQWRRIAEAAVAIDMALVPLIQIQGHLEWVLRHPLYHAWRENGQVNEICPQHPEARRRVIEWAKEAMTAFPQSGIIHLGADETWNLCSCPKCHAAAAAHPDGKMGVYLDHIGDVCQVVSAEGFRPMIWADMFWRENRLELASRLPRQTILVDWQYKGAGPYAGTAALEKSGLEVWGASALRCAYDITQTMAPLGLRRENIQGWEQRFGEGRVAGVIHTNWARGRSTYPPYGPWEGWLAALMPNASAACLGGAELTDQVLAAEVSDKIEPLQKALEALHSEDPFERAALDWWRLGARHRALFLDACQSRAGRLAYGADTTANADDPSAMLYYDQLRDKLRERLSLWERDARQWWTARGWSDADEYFAGRLAAPSAFLSDE